MHCFILVCYKMTEASILGNDDNNETKSRKDWHMLAKASEAAWLGLFTALINGRLSRWHKQSWQQQKPQTVANPSSSHYHRCMRGAILPFLPDLSLWAFRGWTKIWNSYILYVNIWHSVNIQKLINCADTYVYRLCLAYGVALQGVGLTTLQVLYMCSFWTLRYDYKVI